LYFINVGILQSEYAKNYVRLIHCYYSVIDRKFGHKKSPSSLDELLKLFKSET